jgi:ketosteroid isomerase-like protein
MLSLLLNKIRAVDIFYYCYLSQNDQHAFNKMTYLKKRIFMKIKLFAFILFLLLPVITFAAVSTVSSTETNTDSINAIQSDLSNFATSWNQGETKEIIKHYKKGNSTILISSNMIRGYKNIAAFFHKNYSSKNEMGTITFSHVEINLLSSRYAMATGEWSIQRDKGNKTGGIFSVLYENTLHGWKIALDHTSGL